MWRRRTVLGGIGALVSLAGCSLPESHSDDRPATGTENATPAPSQTSSDSSPSTSSPTPTSTPEANRTQYPTVAGRTGSRTAVESLSEGAVLTDSGWRSNVPADALSEEAVQFLDDTDFEASCVVAFGAWLQWGKRIQLTAVRRRDSRVVVTYSPVDRDRAPNADWFRYLLVRLPNGERVPDAVRIERTDDAA